MLIDAYDLDIFTPPCEPGAERYAAVARLAVDISAVLPYLNATLRGALYHESANALTWKKGGHNIAFALNLSLGRRQLADCPPLMEPDYADKRRQLEEIVIDAPAGM
jgi:ArsR family metal-binding transcriptional regulator